MSIDAAIFIGFLLVNLVVGLRYGRGIKNIKDYALGGRSFSTAALVATIVATFTTGSSFFVVLSKTYSDGLTFVIAGCCHALQFFIAGFFLIPRMAEFMGSLSVAEVMGTLYGKHIRIITAISAILWNVGGIAVQFKVFGNLFNYFLGIPSAYAIIIASTIVILYSSFGGVKAVTYTDVIQFLTFGFVIPAIGIVVWNHFQAADLSLAKTMDTPLFNYHNLANLEGEALISFILLILYFSVPSIGPIHFQRISMGRNITQVRKAWLIAAILLVLIELAMSWIPFLMTGINPGLDPTQIVSYIINNFTDFGIIKGLLIVGVSAMAMSSADSFINGSAILFGHDIKEVLNIKVDNLLLSKIFSLVLGVFAVYLALSTNDLLAMVMTAASFYMPIVTPPLVFAILGFRTSTKSVLIGMGAGFATVIIWKFLDTKLNCIIFAMVANILFFFGSHVLLRQPGGWVGIKDTKYLDNSKKEKSRKITAFLKAVREFEITKFCKKTAPKNELTYMWLGIYFIIFTFTTMYSTQVELLKENGKIILTIYQTMMVTGVVTAMYPIWPARIKYEIIVQLAWNIVIFYMLIFFTCFFVMVSDFGQLQFAVFILNTLIAAILLGWKLGAIMTVIGFYLSIQFYKYYSALDHIDSALGSPQFMFIYALILSGTVLVMFFKPKQQYQELTEEKNQHLAGRIGSQEKQLHEALALKGEFIRNVSHEYHAPMTGVISLAQVLSESYDKLTNAQRKKAADDIYKSSIKLESFDANITSLSRLSKAEYKLKSEPVDLSQLLNDRIEICRKLYEENKENREFTLNIEEGITLSADKYYLTQTIDNLIINAISYCQKGRITITLKHDKNEVICTIQDEGIGIPTNELEDIFNEFVVSSKTRTPAGGRGVGLALCKKVIGVHNGKIWAESNGEKGAVFRFILPLLTY